MADEGQLKILRKGVAAWNDWREENPDVFQPYLRKADLREAHLLRRTLREFHGANDTAPIVPLESSARLAYAPAGPNCGGSAKTVGNQGQLPHILRTIGQEGHLLVGLQALRFITVRIGAAFLYPADQLHG